MSDAKDFILKKLAKKEAEYKVYRQQSMGFIEPRKLVSDFIKAIEKARDEAKSGPEFVQHVDGAYAVLINRIRRWDGGAQVEIVWHKESDAEVWEDLRVLGVKIRWGNAYKTLHPDSDDEMYVSIDQIFIEEMLQQ